MPAFPVDPRCPQPQVPAPARTLVLGGARSGKSAYAEHLLAGAREVTYIATAPPRPGDREWDDRVTAHRQRRPADWRTCETTDLISALSEPGPILVECLSLWLAAVMDDVGAWDGGPLGVVRNRADELVQAWRSRNGLSVVVSSEVGSGVVPATAAGRLYRDELGRLNTAMAEAADSVVLVVAGQPLAVKTPAFSASAFSASQFSTSLPRGGSS